MSKNDPKCLHCRIPSDKIQVRCDECDNFVCEDCHWCHEFQGRHEIRVCGFCDVFYCKHCDEMDQCTDCHETICGNCSSVLSCKFCGGSLCEDCATACGRCGIVLCQRDAKFAVECDTCRLPYCLVCLAGTPKDPCVRCGQRPTKRMEQLVHLRLKSIYKAFSTQESSSSSGTNNNNKNHCHHPVAAQEKADAAAAALLAELEAEEEKKERKSTKKKKKKKPPKEEEETSSIKETATEDSSMHVAEPPSHHSATEEAIIDPLEEELAELIEANDANGLERLLGSVKGVPGRAAFRKLAKKAIKRIRASDTVEEEGEEEYVEESSPTNEPLGPDEMLRLISDSKRSRGGYECVMHMAPSIVGWVIGKGGQRIRDMMDDSGARIWIDQDSMSPTAPRIVYVSGQRSNVDQAVTAIQELIAAAPAVASPRTPITEGIDSGMSSAPVIPEDSAPAEDTPSNLKPRCKTKLTCEPRYVPLLIGRRGWTIKNIQDTTGAKVDIDQTVCPRLITISGREGAVEDAKLMVEDVLSYPHAHPLEGESEKPPETKPEAKSPATPVRTLAETPPNEPVAEQTPVVPEKRTVSPPSSLIMNHDVKSTVSVSSSLSSTPEPLRKINSSATANSTVPPNGFHNNNIGPTPPPPPPQSPMVGPSPMYHESPFASQMHFVSSSTSPHMSPHMVHPSHMPHPSHMATSTPPPPTALMATAPGGYPIPNYMPGYAGAPPMGTAPPGWNPMPSQPYYSPSSTKMMHPSPTNVDFASGAVAPIGASLLPRSPIPDDMAVFPPSTASDAKVVDSLFGSGGVDDSSTKELILSGLKGLGLGGGGDSEGLWTAGTESSLFSWNDSEQR